MEILRVWSQITTIKQILQQSQVPMNILLSITFKGYVYITPGFPSGSDGKESACNMGDLGLIPGLGRSPGEGNGYLLQYSGLENSMDRGTWLATFHSITQSQTRLTD